MSHKNPPNRTAKKVHQLSLAGLCGCLALMLLIATDTPLRGQVAEEAPADVAAPEEAVPAEEPAPAEEVATEEAPADAGSGEIVTESGSGDTVTETGSGTTEQPIDEGDGTEDPGDGSETPGEGEEAVEPESEEEVARRQRNEKLERQIHLVAASFYDELSDMRREIKPKPITLHGSADDEIGFFRRILGEIARWFGLVED